MNHLLVSAEQHNSPSLANVLPVNIPPSKRNFAVATHSDLDLHFFCSGLMGSNLHFPKCAHRASSVTEFIDLSLSIPVKKNCSLEECLEDWTKSELIEDVECSQCKDHQKYSLKNGFLTTFRGDASKQLKIVRPPESLCLHIHRLVTDHWCRIKKLDEHVAFQEQLDLTPYCVCTDPVKYQLISVVVHNGRNGNGHYSTYRRNLFQNSWFHLSDEVVRCAKINEVLNSKAYLLLYEKIANK